MYSYTFVEGIDPRLMLVDLRAGAWRRIQHDDWQVIRTYLTQNMVCIFLGGSLVMMLNTAVLAKPHARQRKGVTKLVEMHERIRT